MDSLVLRDAVTALSVAEQVELRDFIDVRLAAQIPILTERQRATVQERAAELDADPSLAVPWEEINAELVTEFG